MSTERGRIRNRPIAYELPRLLRRVRSGEACWADARRWFWIFVRRWETELCAACGRPVCAREFSWWHAPDALWMEVEGDATGIRCPSCFTADCRRTGYAISWRPIVEYALCRGCFRVPESCLCAEDGPS